MLFSKLVSRIFSVSSIYNSFNNVSMWNAFMHSTKSKWYSIYHCSMFTSARVSVHHHCGSSSITIRVLNAKTKISAIILHFASGEFTTHNYWCISLVLSTLYGKLHIAIFSLIDDHIRYTDMKQTRHNSIIHLERLYKYRQGINIRGFSMNRHD